MPVASSVFHWQPVRNRKKIASRHTRSGTGGRPPPNFYVLTRGGINGLNFAHIASVNPNTPLIAERVIASLLARGTIARNYTG